MAESARKSWMVAAIVVLVVATALRCVILGDAFWLDEIWSWDNVQAFRSFADVFAGNGHEQAKLDNNHILISMWMYVFGDTASWEWYRIPCFVAGMVTVWAMFDIDRGPLGVWIPGALAAPSMLLILYATEARGYALAGCFALIAFRLLALRADADFALRPLEYVAYPILGMLAVLGHLVAMHFVLGAMAWTAVHLFKRVSTGVAVRRLLLIHGPLGVLLVAHYLGHVRYIEFGGGGDLKTVCALHDAAAWLTGAPNVPVLAWPALLLVFGIVAGELVARAREGSFEWVFVATSVLVAPVLILVIKGTHEVLYARHFFVGCVVVLWYLGRALLRQWATRPIVVLAFLVVFGAGNLYRYSMYLTEGGRGQQPQFVADVAGQSPEVVSIGAPNADEFRVLFQFNYYKRFLPAGKRIARMHDADHHPRGPDWFVFQTVWNEESHTERPAMPPRRARIRLPSGRVYEFVKEYPHYGQSGITWILYRRL